MAIMAFPLWLEGTWLDGGVVVVRFPVAK